MIFYSRKDWWIIGLVSLGVILPACAGLYQLLVNTQPARGWRYLSTSALAGAILLFATYPLYYEVTLSAIKVRSGFMRWEIPLDEIELVEPSRNLLSSPAWSLDRLRIVYQEESRRKSLLISPAERDAFLQKISTNYPYLQLVNGRLVRVGQ